MFIRGPGGENYLLSDLFTSDSAEYLLLISVNLQFSVIMNEM